MKLCLAFVNVKTGAMTTIQGFVSGKVQGVGFRRFLQKRAEALTLVGWTRNLLDGRVEFLVQGPRAVVDEYLDQVRKGNAFSHVENVVTEEIEAIAAWSFEIHPDEE